MNYLLRLPAATRACVVAGLALLPQSVSANEAALLADVKIIGNSNVLYITQADAVNGPDLLQSNTIAVEIEGHRNGRPISQWSAGRFPSPLMPGDLFQSGTNNSITISVVGDDNLFALLQSGENNRASVNTSGSFNQFTVTQTGNGNSAGLTQTGNGNTIVVSQNSW